ncbi:MAG: hypothetical protein AAF449_01485 [Myxococcota bacterium]
MPIDYALRLKTEPKISLTTPTGRLSIGNGGLRTPTVQKPIILPIRQSDVKARPVLELVEELYSTRADDARRTCAEELKTAIQGMQRSIDSLEIQLKDFYDAQIEHQGATLNDYKRMVASLDEQVRSYIDDRMTA